MTLETGNAVKLMFKGSVIGVGKVVDTSPDAYCHGVRLGDEKVSITVGSWSFNVSLPFPFGDVETIDKAKSSPFLWKRRNLVLCDDHAGSARNTPENLGQLPQVNSSPADLDNSPDAFDLCNRKTWLMKECTLMHPSLAGKELARARIVCNGAFQYVEGAPLGDLRVGVLVLDMFSIDEDLIRTYFPTFAPESPLVVAWDVANLHFPGIGVPTLNLFDGGADSVAFNTEKDKVKNLQRKRHYNFNKRKSCNPEDKERKNDSMKRSKVMKETEIFSDWREECCKDLCCRQVQFDSIKKEREEYWNQSPANRCTAILDKMHSREETLKHAGKLVFDSKAVCKKAFYTLYGFGRTLFFEYQKRAEFGMRVGFHSGTHRQKPTKRVFQALIFMRDVIQDSSEPQPHLEYRGNNGTDKMIHKIPICLGKDGVLMEVNRLLELNGDHPISMSTFYAAWRKHFANVLVYSTCAFAKCHICLSLKERMMKEKREEQRKAIADERSLHLGEAMSRRTLYYGHRTLATFQPEKYLSIIHDKMDQAKTGVPRLLETSKKLSDGCSPLPFSLTGMLTHGREPGAFGHLSLNGLWPGDPNFTITSLSKCLRDLERWDGNHSGDLSIVSTDGIKEPLFKALLDPSPFKTGYLDPKGISVEHFCGTSSIAEEEHVAPGSFRPLPENLLLQLDNSPKDNKNKYLLAWCSHLTGRGHFKTVQVSFLMVGHTHEDIDAMFSKVSSQLRTHEVESVHGLMAEVWDCVKTHPVPSFIQEVADYKSFSDSFLKNMDGQSFPMSFRFFVRNNQPMMQYREDVNGAWYPLGGQSVWKADPVTKKAILPSGEPFAKPMRSQLRRLKEVKSFIEKYISWKDLTAPHAECNSSDRSTALKCYWESILGFLKRDFTTKIDLPHGREAGDNDHGQDLLHEGFWPLTNHGTGCQEETALPAVPVHPLEAEHAAHLQEIDEIFVGNLSERLPETFAPLAHIRDGDMCVIRPDDDFENKCPKSIWLARALSPVDTDKNSPYYLHFRIEWWRPVHSSRQKSLPLSVRYKNWSIPSRDWERDPGYGDTDEIYMHASSTIYAWKPAGIFPRTNVRISGTAHSVIKAHFDRLREEGE